MLLLHLMARNELEFTYRGAITFRDLETGRPCSSTPASSAGPGQQQLQPWLQATARRARTLGFDYQLLNTTDPLTAALREFLRRRARTA